MSEERILCASTTYVKALDERGPGNASHKYQVYCSDGSLLDSPITFQTGPIQEEGVNGVQNEDLLMIVIDRLIGFQTGDYACDENEEALRHLISAASILQLRTAKRKARGVEGKSEK